MATIMSDKNGVTVGKTFVIEGGALGKDVWAPREVTTVGHRVFIQLRESDRKLQRFIGLDSESSTPLAFNPFLAELSDLRNNAVGDAIWAHLRSEDPMIHPSEREKLIKRARATVDPDDLPPFVQVSVGAIEHDGNYAPRTTLNLLLTLMHGRSVDLELDANALYYIRIATLKADAKESTGSKREAPLDFLGDDDMRSIRTDKRRKIVLGKVTPPGATMPVTIHRRPREWSYTYIRQAAMEVASEIDAIKNDGKKTQEDKSEHDTHDVAGLEDSPLTPESKK